MSQPAANTTTVTPQQQQQQQQLVRPEDGEIGMVVAQIEKHLTQLELGGSVNNTTSPLPAGTPSSRALDKLLSEKEEDISKLFPASLITTIKDHFSPVKLKLSDPAALAAKDEGNKLFQALRYDEAVLAFSKAMLSAHSNDAYAVLLGNRSAAFLSAGMTLASALDSNFALIKLKPSSVQLRIKLLDRRARCLASLGFQQESEKDAATCKEMNEKLEKGENGEKDAASIEIEDRFNILSEKQAKVTDTWIFESDADTKVHLHPDLVFSMDKQALPYSATDSFRRIASLKKQEQLEKQSENTSSNDIVRELPTVSCVRTDSLLVVCALCCVRSSALYPSEEFRAKGYRCRGLFCSEKCSALYWKKYGEEECGNPFYMAASAETVCTLRLINNNKKNDNNNNKLSLESSNKKNLFENLPEQVRPKVDDSLNWNIQENFDLYTPRSRETEANNTAAFGGFESSVALIGLILSTFKSTKEAKEYVVAYRKLIAFLQPIMFTDRVFQSVKGSSSSSQSQQQQTHATVPVCCAVGYYPTVSLFNHSCDPNCHIVFRGNPFSSSSQLHLRLIKPVQEGQMLTVCWAPMFAHKNTNHSTRSRIQVLRKLYGFSCCCSACSQNPDEAVPRDRQEMMVKAADYYQKGRRLIRERKELPEAVTVLKQSLEILFKHVCPVPEPPIFVVAKTYDAIAQASMMLGNTEQCIEYVRKRVEILDQLQGENSFEFVMELEKLTTLLKTLPSKSGESNSNHNNGDEERKRVEARTVAILKRLYPESKSLKSEIELVENY